MHDFGKSLLSEINNSPDIGDNGNVRPEHLEGRVLTVLVYDELFGSTEACSLHNGPLLIALLTTRFFP